MEIINPRINVLRLTFLSFLMVTVATGLFAQKLVQPVLGHRSVSILKVDNLEFKDLNKNGKLDKYEDWRLSAEERSADLLSKMSVEEKAGFMLINTVSMIGAKKAEAEGLVASDFNETGGQTRGGFGEAPANSGAGRTQTTTGATGVAGVLANMSGGGGVTKFVKEYNNRHFIYRMNESPKNTAEWANKLQALCESQPLGIPAIVASNPRNNITVNASLGTSAGASIFSAWPGELGLSAMRDLKLTREFADIARQEWLAVGLRKGYMYMADLATEPRWSRVNGTFGEDAEWVAKMITEVIYGFQGEKLSASSVALTTKHFPGGGSGEDGQDSHFEWGKKEIYPGGMFENNLIPFRAAIKAGTSSMMPYYSLPSGTKYEEVGFAFNKGAITDLLRNEMGFKGIINSDTGPLTGMPWGVENLTKQERYKKAIEAGVNLFSGESDPAMLLEIISNGMVDMSYIDNSVIRLLNEKFEMGLFENPYVDENAAEKIVNNAKFKERADLALRKSIVLLENDTKTLPVQAKTKIYFETYSKGTKDKLSDPGIVYTENGNKYPVTFVNTPEEADVVLLWLVPTGNSLFASTGAPVSISLSKCSVDVDYVNKLTVKKPTILVVNYTNPWVIDEIYNNQTKGNFKAVLATFGTTQDALLDVVTGKFNPSGKMPFSTPISDEAVTNQKEDVPGYLEGKGYALFNYNQGLSYK
ncbi:beta-hexosaminidase [Aquipluma nitroreducens]|uniref:beta-glucosidase n=1 Tax=Aquipluma nitroreducens TaxID=2010828 RepID=A0A5K7SB21_9BACT|nr:glycoside hydrolase family 3 N-terminal domain-containing protein [Aquipluma nitroreducens]BBE18637.1 beta-hexosaminidase [Aquipluma nitroreducens]